MEMRTRISLSVVLCLTLTLGYAAAQTAGAVYLDPSQPINVRVDDLIRRMTLEQKAQQLVNQARAIDLQVPNYDWLGALEVARRCKGGNSNGFSRADWTCSHIR
jgi:hypothetical protein